MYAVITLIALTVLVWSAAVWATFLDDELDVEEADETLEEEDHRKAA